VTGIEATWVTDAEAELAEPRSWHARRVDVRVDGDLYRLRLVRFERGWIASADSVEGPTLGVDPSPYLAARQALEPLGIGLVTALSALSRLEG
jgi:hypothetical protein